MKKIFKIACYDFRRLMLNPITLIVMVVALIGILILGATYKIPTTPAYTAVTSGETTREVYNNFKFGDENLDTEHSLRQLIDDAQNYISKQRNCSDSETLRQINNNFKNIANEIEKYEESKKFGSESSSYIKDNNIEEIKQASNQLKQFILYFKSINIFESNLIFHQQDFENLEKISAYFEETTNSNESVSKILDNLLENFDYFNNIRHIIENKIQPLAIDSEKLNFFQSNYIDKAKEKLTTIENEMLKFNISGSDATHVDDMKSLITNFKLTCESAKFGVENELYLLLQNHFKNLKGFYKCQTIIKEETTLKLAKINFFLEDENPYYTAYQTPLNFNTALGQATAYDNTYFLMSIVGFFTILLGIFCAYKLFGRDRKTGQMDVILSQDVTFGQTFAGKFLAIVLSTTYVMGVFLLFTFVWSLLFYPTLEGGILAVFNLSSPYTISPFLFLLIKVVGIELQVIFWSVITIFLMNLSRKFELFFGIGVALFVFAILCNIFLNGSLVYCLFPFIHADITCLLGGGKMNAGFLQTPLYTYGNFFISIVYYIVVVALLYNFTKQLFKKN